MLSMYDVRHRAAPNLLVSNGSGFERFVYGMRPDLIWSIDSETGNMNTITLLAAISARDGVVSSCATPPDGSADSIITAITRRDPSDVWHPLLPALTANPASKARGHMGALLLL